VFEGSLTIERVATARTSAISSNERDCAAMIASVRDAANRSDLRALQPAYARGVAENWYAPRPASFIEDIARRAIDAGAHAVIGHWAHMLRGIEFRNGPPDLLQPEQPADGIRSRRAADDARDVRGIRAGQGYALPSDSTCRASRTLPEGSRIGFYAIRGSRGAVMCVVRLWMGRVRWRWRQADADRPRYEPRAVRPSADFRSALSPEVGRAIADRDLACFERGLRHEESIRRGRRDDHCVAVVRDEGVYFRR
jgi:hypothetical protein